MLLPSMSTPSEYQILAEIEKINKQLRNSIDAAETRFLVKFGYQNKKIRELEDDNRRIKNNLENLEKQLKNTNVLIFGLGKFQPKPPRREICKVLGELLQTDVTSEDIKNLYFLGKTEQAPLKIEFGCYCKKMQILKNCERLKGTGIRIGEDLTLKEREELKILKVFLKQEKQKGLYKKCFINKNKLVLDNESYSSEQLLEIYNTDKVSSRVSNLSKKSSVPSKESIKPSEIKNISHLSLGNLQGYSKECLKHKEVIKVPHASLVDIHDHSKENLKHIKVNDLQCLNHKEGSNLSHKSLDNLQCYSKECLKHKEGNNLHHISLGNLQDQNKERLEYIQEEKNTQYEMENDLIAGSSKKESAKPKEVPSVKLFKSVQDIFYELQKKLESFASKF
ncbi:unnamed protein product [Psylliodes chrysocephalus]|uniref:Uncharacterized protein n=1 Tax=Psylliodes chrysocephalus TaxID=3402493 RepID=A0A9P0CDX4_9CUCU|nr:unnamed protein product [Psylliodes chrysocephala]